MNIENHRPKGNSENSMGKYSTRGKKKDILFPSDICSLPDSSLSRSTYYSKQFNGIKYAIETSTCINISRKTTINHIYTC